MHASGDQNTKIRSISGSLTPPADGTVTSLRIYLVFIIIHFKHCHSSFLPCFVRRSSSSRRLVPCFSILTFISTVNVGLKTANFRVVLQWHRNLKAIIFGTK